MNTIRFTLILIIALMASCRFAYAQCDHTTNSKARFEAMRILPPVQIRAFNGLSIEATYQDNTSINAVSFDISKDTVRPGDFSKTFKQGYWWLIYDSCDGKYLYTVVPVSKEQMK